MKMGKTAPTVLVLVCILWCRCSCVFTRKEMATEKPTPLLPLEPCFVSCHCDGNGRVACSADETFLNVVPAFNRFLLNSSSGVTSHVYFKTSSPHLPSFLPHLPAVHFLSLAENSIRVVQNDVLPGMRLQELDLSHNSIQDIESQAFHDLNKLLALNLSHNQLSTVSKSVFANFPLLKVLDLRWNQLLFLPLYEASVLPHLKVLLLSNNRLSYLLPGSLINLPSLQILSLDYNSLRSFEIEILDEVPSLQTLDVSHNPFHCSCALAGLKSVFNSTTVTLKHKELTSCATPPQLRYKLLRDIIFDQGNCTAPLTDIGYDAKNVLYVSDVKVTCDIRGDPTPAVLWVTPWGHQFADQSHLSRLEAVCSSCRQQREYQGIGIALDSVVTVGGGGRSLSITNFRSFFNGNITCQAFNYLGNDTAVRNVKVFLAVKGHVYRSMMIGGFCAAAFLCVGLIVGSIKLIVLACLKRFGKPKDVVRTPVTGVVNTDEEYYNSLSDDRNCRENSDDFSDFYPPETPFTTPTTVSPPLSPTKIHTPKEEAFDDDTLPGWNILDTMEEVRWRLRYGVGRKMQTVKRNVHAIKETGRRNVNAIRESGSVYVHNIMESGSTAAHKVRAGVVLGVETVKYHMQSIKEFCGTGDMGNQTISMISVETNLDTNETREVVKSITIV